MPPNVAAQASQAAAQGQQQLTNYNNQATQSKNDYGTYQGQADAANNAVQQQAQFIQGAGSGTNLYNNQLSTFLGNGQNGVGYDAGAAQQATQGLAQGLGQQADYNNYMNTAASKFGLNAGGFAAANAAGQAQNNNNVNMASQLNNAYLAKYATAQTGANQATGLGVQTEQNALTGLQNTYTNAAGQRDQAAQMMQFYNGLAQQQGSLNASQQQAYATAQQQYAAAGQAAAQAALLSQQTNLANQQFTHTADLYKNTAQDQANQQSAAYNKSVGLSPNGQHDEQGNKILTGKF